MLDATVRAILTLTSAIYKRWTLCEPALAAEQWHFCPTVPL